MGVEGKPNAEMKSVRGHVMKKSTIFINNFTNYYSKATEKNFCDEYSLAQTVC